MYDILYFIDLLVLTYIFQMYAFKAEEDIYEDAEEDDFEYYEVGAGDAPYILPTGNLFNI